MFHKTKSDDVKCDEKIKDNCSLYVPPCCDITCFHVREVRLHGSWLVYDSEF